MWGLMIGGKMGMGNPVPPVESCIGECKNQSSM